MEYPKFILYKGRKFHRLKSNPRYYQGDFYHGTGKKGRTKKLLHRYVWEEANGKPIPKGFVVHHIDHNPLNNKPSNLELQTTADHVKFHADENRGVSKPVSKAALDAAAKWHGSPEGLEWHKKHGKESWDGREQIESVCVKCGKKFMAWMRDAKHCSHACEQKGNYQKHRTLEVVCGVCGKKFLANKYKPTSSCSYKCSNSRPRFGARKAKGDTLLE